MKALLFNTHDVVLVLTISTFLLLVILELRDGYRSRKTPCLVLAGFYTLNALLCFYTLIFWSEAIRYRAFEFFHYLYFPLEVCNFILGPLLLFAVMSFADKQPVLKSKQLLHFVPAIAAAIYLYFVCFRFDLDTRSQLLLGAQIYQHPDRYFHYYVSLAKLLPLVYAVASLGYLRFLHIKNIVDRARLKTLGMGFSFLWAWVATTHFIGRHYAGELSDYMGIAGNYLNLGLAALLVFKKVTSQNSVISSSQSATKVPTHTNEEIKIEAKRVETIVNAMESQKLFLNPNLSLERFSEQVHLSPRDVSLVINRRFQKNFHEFLNSYRVQAAKQKLRDTNSQNIAIKDIALASGFNSKATFNRFFKKMELVTPSEYRQKHLHLL